MRESRIGHARKPKISKVDDLADAANIFIAGGETIGYHAPLWAPEPG